MQAPFDGQAELAFVRAYLEGRVVDERFVERMKCVPRILAALNARMGRPLQEHDVADLAQDTLLLVLQKLDSFAGRAPLEGWIYRICALELMNRVRRKRRREGRTESLDAHGATPPAASPELAEFEDVHRALERLGGGDADVVRLKHFDDLTFDEIGRRLGISPNTAKTRYYRGLGKLAVYLRPQREESRERAAR